MNCSHTLTSCTAARVNRRISVGWALISANATSDNSSSKAIETPDIENEHGVPWLIVYGISANTRAFWSLENARRVLGYEPQDDSELKFTDRIIQHLTVDDPAGPGKVGD